MGALAWRGMGGIPAWLSAPPIQWAAGLAGLVWLFVGLRVFTKTGGDPSTWSPARRMLMALSTLPLIPVLLAVPVLTMPLLVERLDAIPLLRSPVWLGQNLLLVGALLAGIILLVVGLNALAIPLRPLRLVGGALSFLVARALTATIGVTLVCWAGVAMFHLLVDGVFSAETELDGYLPLAAFFAVLVAGVIVIPLPGLISPHRPYRELLARGFIVRRLADSRIVAAPRADEITLSSLRPREGRTKYPELLICASANLTEVGSTPAGANVLPLVITGESVSIPTEPGASVATTDLEAMNAPHHGYGVVKPRPMLSLAGAIAIAGAAVSPAMGRMTLPTLRPILTAFNIRLGVWLPNPLSDKGREWAAERKSGGFAVGIDQLIWELFGIHSSKSPLVYASDGGHYENLALIELLRRRATTIWSIDSSVDPQGRCLALAQAIRMASSELNCRIELDIDAFAARDASGEPRVTWASGTIRYADASVGTLHVVRLGLTERHSGALRRYRSSDRGFPFHSTLSQIFKADRFDAYQLLGRETTGLLLDSIASTPSTR
jgi:hypothetical protein